MMIDWKLIAAGVAVVAFIVFQIWAAGYWYDKGEQAAFHKVAVQNKEAVDAVNQVRARVRDCHDAGRVWSQSASQCE